MTGPVRVLIVHPRDLGAPTLGGIQTFLHDFVKFAPADFDITLAGVTQNPHTRPVGSFSRVEVEGRAAMMLPLGPAGQFPRNPLTLLRMCLAQVRLRRQLLDRQSIVQIHRPFKPIVLIGRRGPGVQFVHLDLEAWPGPAGWPRLGGLYRSFADPAIERMAHVYVVSERGAQLLRDSHPKISDRIDFVPVWHDPAVFRVPTPAERDALRLTRFPRLGIAADAPVVLWAGRLDAGKDPLLALDAVARATSHGGGIELIVAGDGELRAQAEARATALGIGGRVHFLGDVPRDEIAELMRVADCLLLTSHSEGGGPRVVVEALASGLPVVATDVGEVRRTVVDRINGRVAGDHAPETLAEALTWTLAQPRNALSAAAISAAAPYTAERVLAPLYATYRELAAATR